MGWQGSPYTQNFHRSFLKSAYYLKLSKIWSVVFHDNRKHLLQLKGGLLSNSSMPQEHCGKRYKSAHPGAEAGPQTHGGLLFVNLCYKCMTFYLVHFCSKKKKSKFVSLFNWKQIKRPSKHWHFLRSGWLFIDLNMSDSRNLASEIN